MVDSMSDRYQVVYDIGLLDDIHNYFPGLLYEPERFRTVSDVLEYLQQNTRRRFNLYEHGRQRYTGSVPENTFGRSTEVPIVNRWSDTQRATQAFDIDVAEFSILFPLLRGLANPLPPPPAIQRVTRQPGIFEDVLINASIELINSASNVRTLLMELEESCSICQDRMREGENIRRLNACHHEFHSGCVDSWFLRNSVFCPICRHDIRDPTSPVLRAQRSAIAVEPLMPQAQAQVLQSTITRTTHLRPRRSE